MCQRAATKKRSRSKIWIESYNLYRTRESNSTNSLLNYRYLFQEFRMGERKKKIISAFPLPCRIAKFSAGVAKNLNWNYFVSSIPFAIKPLHHLCARTLAFGPKTKTQIQIDGFFFLSRVCTSQHHKRHLSSTRLLFQNLRRTVKLSCTFHWTPLNV